MKKRYPELEIQDIRIFLGASAPADAGTRTGGGHSVQVGADHTVDPIANLGGAEKIPKDIEKTQEYKDFKKMLGRLKKGTK
jgi:hypothetical protein